MEYGREAAENIFKIVEYGNLSDFHFSNLFGLKFELRSKPFHLPEPSGEVIQLS